MRSVSLFRWIGAVIGMLVLALVAVAGWVYSGLESSPPSLHGELRKARVDAAGITWDFSYYLSDRLSPGAPIVFVLHGSGMTGPQVRSTYAYRFDELADEHGFLPVYPTGFDNHWNDCRDGADYLANVQDVDDVAFFRAMIDYLATRHDADRERVFVTGLSNGGHMAYRLALQAPAMIAAIAPIAASLPVWAETGCEPGQQGIPVAIFNGTEDPVNPYAGGLVSIFGNASRGTVMGSLETARYFATLAGHGDVAQTVSLADTDNGDASHIELTTWRTPGLDEVRHYAVIGGGHTVPSRTKTMPAFLVGPTNADIEAADEIWDFFRQVMLASRQR